MASETQCAGTIKRRNPAWDQPQCTRPGKVERGGKSYCGYHDPVVNAEKSEASSPKKETL